MCAELYQAAEPLLAVIEEAWPLSRELASTVHARQIREHRADYLTVSEKLQGELVTRIAKKELKPITGFMMTEYISEMDRIVRHTKKIAGVLEKSHTVA
jgi:hypothetical protein